MRSTVIFAAIAALSGVGRITSAATVKPAAFDSPALATAIRQAASGDTVCLAAGTYELTELIKPRSGIKLFGAGQEKTRLVYKGTKAGVLDQPQRLRRRRKSPT